MPKQKTTISEFMTKSPHKIGAEQPLSKAHEVMRRYKIRHLPVLHGGKLVGMVSLSDLHLVESLPGVTPEEVTVEEAMTQDVYRVAPDASLREVVAEMAKRKLGSAVVMQGQKVTGVFTTIDALRVLEAMVA
jgi:acetoin utilization protein AcuB